MTTADPRDAPPSDNLGTVIARRSFYGALWRGVPRELGFLVVTFPIALTGFIVTIALFFPGLGSIIAVFGVALAIAALYVGRGFGLFEIVRLEWAGRPPIVRPEWQDARARQGFFGWLRSVLGNGHYWLYLLHTMVVGFIVSVVTWSITIAWLAMTLGGLTTWIWNLADPRAGRDWNVFGWPSDANAVTLGVIAVVVPLLIGLLALALLPFVTRGLVLLHQVIARGMLGAFRSDALQRQLIAANASRGAAVSAEGQSLRRLERDIHDGPQQRLVRLQMDLAAVDRQIGNDPEKARTTLAEALQQSKDALEELRALSRGFAPPILLDRGLVAALESAATRSPLPTRVSSSVPPGTILPQETERNAYFVASEAITNAAKHSRGTAVEVRLALIDEGAADAGAPLSSSAPDAWLELAVTDDGVGGAALSSGHGLEGLEERLRGLGGILTLDSPVGGPTTLRARFPLLR